MDSEEPLRLKKRPKNWYTNGRWHKVRPRRGLTTFCLGDICQFKADLIDVEICDIIVTVEPGIFLYEVQAINPYGSRHRFSCYGNELLLLKRYKPKFEERTKPKLVFVEKRKPQLKFKQRPAQIILQTPRPVTKVKFIPPEEGVVGRVSYWTDYGAWGPQWVFKDFKNEKELEEEFWKRVEERRIKRRSRWARDGDWNPIATDRWHHPELVCVEWFPPYYQPKQDKPNAQDQRDVSPRPTTGVRGSPESNDAASVGGGEKQGKANQPVRVPRPRNNRGGATSSRKRKPAAPKPGPRSGTKNADGGGTVRRKPARRGRKSSSGRR